ncbi:hypothetical protein [Microbispora sp. NPDC049125]|uniref:hypothetical protein n=1 Tax=Microbispora sp. NPDC049125 TaxID=3154929 RepID=UPI0034670D33
MNIRTVLAGTAVAGALAAGLMVAPAAQAATQTAAAAGPVRHFFGNTYSGYDRGDGENRGDRSYFGRGYWIRDGGRYWFYGDLFDRDHDREYSYVWFRWHDRSGSHLASYRTFGHREVNHFGGFRKSNGFNDFDIRVCEGGPAEDCGGWHDVF